MGKPETDLAPRIREKTLELLMEKEPEEITVRDIAKACGVTATSIYYYYKDREALFNEIKLECIEKMDTFISRQIEKGTGADPLGEIRAGLAAFRDWAFSNPRIALLVMERMKADTRADSEKLKKYYKSNNFAKDLLDKAAQRGCITSGDTLLDANLCIAALWGAVEAVLRNRTIPKYWSKKGSVNFTNKMIDLLLASLAREDSPRVTRN